ncbi:dynein axonemal heavy chain 7-like [Diabrotica undecimpunctata]|uniref:dynein axonemal heavy chain 7-like n=1 Tax=Diabrotica undecimpunctata TaxID=50387 RepID=UPI003B63C24E
MLHPDNDKISEIVLYSIGFTEASMLSKKITCVFNYLQDTLSSKGKYYFGLSKLMKIFRDSENLKIKHPSLNENDIVFTVLTNVLSREVSSDNIKEFHSILHHIFTDSVIIGENNSLSEGLKIICENFNLSWSQQFGLKTLEVYECIQSMSCTILVGKSNNKTTIIRLSQTLTQDIDGAKLNLNFVVPNCYNYQILYGYSSKPNEWMDGLIATLFRDNIARSLTEKTWTIFDGDINPDWIDNMMSVFKERKLFLESGEILEMSYEDRVIFETDSLQNATPSVVSHSTIIYIDQLIPVWKAIVNSWVASCTSDWIHGFQQQISDICCWVVPPCLEFFQKYCHQLCQLSEINLVKNMLAITQLFLDDVCSVNKKEDDLKNLSTWIQATIIQAGIIGLGALLDTPSRQKFDEFYKQLWRGQNQTHPYPSSFGKLEVSLPHDGLITEYQYIYKQRGNWKVYQDLLKSEKIVENPYMYDFLVPTADTLRYSYILTLYLKNKLPILFLGPNCTGKSILIEDTLRNKFNGKDFEVSHVNFNTYFDAQTTQKLILSKTNKRKEGIYYPSKGKKYIIFIDDLNRVSSDKYGNLNCIELLRQYLDHNVWYDFRNFSKIVLKDANLVTAMSLPDSNYPLKLRFLRHFYVFGINEFSDETITRIFSNTMLHIWRQNGFPGDIGNIVSQIIDATFCIYKKVLTHYQPTLTRSYYHFNLNEFSSVIKGCSLLKKETYDGNKKIYIKLWIHEIFRVFGDRLTNLENNILETEIKKVLSTHFNESLEEIVDTNINKIVLSTINDKDHFKYEEIIESKLIIDLLQDELNKYNSNNKRKLNIIFFEYALEKIFKISRILSLTPGNSIFLGSNGLGRSILTKLISYMYSYICFQPTITQNYTIEHWKCELKHILKETGAIEHKTVFIVNERDLLEEAYLQYIEMLLQNGDVSDIFNLEEKQEILELTRLSAQGGNRNIDISSSDVFLHFNKSCKLNLHLILCFSANGKSLRRKLRHFPSLLKCQIMFWDDWPDEALQQVAEIRISSIDIIPEYKSKSLDTFLYFHRDFQLISKTLRIPLYVSPLCFIHLINIFIDIYNNEKNIIENKRKRFSQGLAKLAYASSQILDMQRVLAEYKPQLAEMTAKAIEMTEQIALETIEVEKASELVRQDEKIASEQAIVAQILKSECEAELAQAIPILEDAISALNTLKPSDITLVKSMKNPPDAIKLVMAAVCVIKDVKPDRIPDPSTGRKTYDYWGPSKRILGDMNFLQSLKDFDKDNIKPEIMVKIRKEFLPHKDFKPHVVAKASSAAEGLCKWIIAMDMYDKVAKEVAPKKEKLGKAEKEYADTVAILNEKKEEVKRIEEKLAGLNALLEDANKKQVKLQQEVDFCNRKLASAQKLIGSLGEEQIRWTKAVENLEKQNVFVLEIFNRVTVINFIVTSEYLRKHFLRIVTQIEKPETRKLKKETYKKINNFETEIFKTENEILETLCESEADILEDEVSIRSLEEYKKEITEEEILIFLKQSNFGTNEITGSMINWEILNEFKRIPALSNFVCDIRIHFDLWKKYILSEVTCNIPEPWKSNLTSFQKLILEKYFKPKNLQLGIKNLIKSVLGTKFVEHFQWTIDDIYNESYSLSPILHLQTEGNDFNENLYILLEKKKVTHTFRSFCISDHSSSPTDLLLEEAREKGFWLLFQNCHLNKRWLEDLETKLVQMNYENTNENFRLWLTAEPTKDIPLELLQNSIKVVYNYPSSFKQTIQHFINKKYISEYFSTGCPGKQEFFTKFLYGLICFHSALIKRRVYDNLFWKPCYNVNENDLKMSIRLLQLSINEAHFSHSDIEKSIFLIGNYQYGTQLNTIYELNVFNNLLNGFLNSEIMRSKNYFLGNVREYGLPKKCDYSDYLKLVRNLPEFDNYEIYGISETFESIYSGSCSKTVIQLLSNTICISEVEQIEHNDFKIISDVDRMLMYLPEQIVVSYSDYVIENEVKTYNNINRNLRETLVLVKQSLSGLKPLTVELENISLQILRGNVPNKWKKWTYFGNSSLSEFITNLVLRINYFKNLTHNNTYWLAAFLYPKALFCKIKLNFSLKYLIPVERLCLNFRLLRDCENSIEGIKITGLSVTNAEWDAEDQCFYEISSKFYNSFSSILLTPNNNDKLSKISKLYELPLYQSSDMTLFICCIKLQFLQRYKHWLKRGVRIVSHVCLTEADSANNIKIKNVALETQYM